MKLEKIKIITAKLVCVSGLHIGGCESEMHIGGIDNPVVRNPLNQRPYIPGSSLKGKIRSLMEWRSGSVGENRGRPLDWSSYKKTQSKEVLKVLQLFGVGASNTPNESEEISKLLGPSRLAFWDCQMDEAWFTKQLNEGLLVTEVKSENDINRLASTANPRFPERVVAGAQFDFHLSIKVLDGDDEGELLRLVYSGLRLLEMDSLGGSGSRGYGKVEFRDIKVDGIQLPRSEFEKVDPFAK